MYVKVFGPCCLRLNPEAVEGREMEPLGLEIDALVRLVSLKLTRLCVKVRKNPFLPS